MGGNGRPRANEREEQAGTSEEYELMLELERLESLREEMEELGISTTAELEAKIAALHRQMDAHEGA